MLYYLAATQPSSQHAHLFKRQTPEILSLKLINISAIWTLESNGTIGFFNKVPWFWRTKVWDQSVDRAMFPSELQGKTPLSLCLLEVPKFFGLSRHHSDLFLHLSEPPSQFPIFTLCLPPSPTLTRTITKVSEPVTTPYPDEICKKLCPNKAIFIATWN